MKGLWLLLMIGGAAVAIEVYMRVTDAGPAPMAPAGYPAGVVAMAQAIKQFEGWAPGSRSYRNNNPGNLRYPEPGASGADDSGFAVFPSADAGWKALLDYIMRRVQGIGFMGPQTSIAQFFQIYAPTSDGNAPTQYAQFVAGKIAAATGLPDDPQTLTLGMVAA